MYIIQVMHKNEIIYLYWIITVLSYVIKKIYKYIYFLFYFIFDIIMMHYVMKLWLMIFLRYIIATGTCFFFFWRKGVNIKLTRVNIMFKIYRFIIIFIHFYNICLFFIFG